MRKMKADCVKDEGTVKQHDGKVAWNRGSEGYSAVLLGQVRS